MSSVIETSPASSKLVWAGRILSGVTIAFLLFDGVIHLTKVAPVVQAFAQLGFPIGLAVALGLLEIVCVALYGYPRTAILGGICLTGYLGGAVAMQLRVGNPLFGETLFPVYVGLLVWGGLYPREPRLHALLPLSRAWGRAPSRKMLWAARLTSALPVVIVLFGSVVKLIKVEGVEEGFRQAGFPEQLIVTIGIIELVCTLTYMIPPTRVLGAILMTGLLGGAVATNLRIGNPGWILPVLVGALVWGGLLLRDPSLRALVAGRPKSSTPLD